MEESCTEVDNLHSDVSGHDANRLLRQAKDLRDTLAHMLGIDPRTLDTAKDEQ